jgi:type IV pilus assembly protein PilV
MILSATYGKLNGFTLIEFVVAVLILTVGLLALLKTVEISIAQNASNKMRNDAVIIADEVMSRERVKPFARIISANSTRTINNGLTVKNYSIAELVTGMGGTPPTSKRVQLTVSWQEKGAKKNHYLTTIISEVQAN